MTLTTEEQQLLDTFTDPDRVETNPFDVHSDEIQDSILAGMMVSTEWLKKALFYNLKPKHFARQANELLCELLYGYYTQYSSVPSEIILRQAIKDLAAAKDQNKAWELNVVSKANTLRMYYVPGADSRAYLEDRLKRFAAGMMVKQAVVNDLTEFLKTNDTASLEKLMQRMNDITKRYYSTDDLIGWDDIVQKAKEQPPLPVVERALYLGDVHFLTSLPWAGKSTLCSDLISTVVRGEPWFGFPTRPVHVLFVNSDQTAYSLFHERFHDSPAMNEHFHAISFDNIPVPMTADYIRAKVDQLGERGVKIEWIVIDTFRTAFLAGMEKGFENDTAVGNLVHPLRKLARERNAAVTLLHHNNKTHNTMAGGAILQGLADAIWNYSKEKDSDKGDLELYHRRFGFVDSFSVQKMGSSFKRLDVSASAKRGREDKLVEFINLFPSTAGEAITLKGVMQQHEEWFASSGWELKTAKNRLGDAQAAGVHPRLEVHPEDQGRTGVPLRYFRV
jgi:hypothetical protein